MAREKQTTLYSRNGIRILHLSNCEVYSNVGLNVHERHETIKHPTYSTVNYRNTDHRNQYANVKHVSKLGFYYTKREYIGNKSNIVESKGEQADYKTYTLCAGKDHYILEYPVRYHRNDDMQCINVDMRPWDLLPGYKGIPDNMINALLNEARKFIDLLIQYKKTSGTHEENYPKRIMIDLFGYEDGPKIQPNDIKILSHGFDLKQSFRKRKESK